MTLTTLENAAFRFSTENHQGILTPREKQVLDLIWDGKITREIASELDITVKTAEAHRSRIFHKLSERTVTDAIRNALRYGLLKVDPEPIERNWEVQYDQVS